jgi:hypothetical protein
MQAEEPRARPSGSGDALGNGSERAVARAAIFEPAIEHDHLVDLSMPRP